MGDVSVSLDLDAKQLYQELQQVQQHFVSFATKATTEGERGGRGFAGGFAKGFGSLGTNFAQALAALGIGHKITELVEYGAKIQDLHERYGVTTDSLQKFGNAAEKNGSSLEAVAKAFRFLEVNQAKALGGNEGMIKAFLDLGITIADLQSLRPEEIFVKIGSSSLNAADMVKTLGRTALELRPTMAGIADKTIELGGAISAIDIKKLKEADDQFKSLQQTLTIFGGTVLGNFVRNFQASIAELVLNSNAGLEEIKGVFSAIGAVARHEFNALVEYFGGVGKALKLALQGQFVGAAEAIRDGVQKGTAEAAQGGNEAISTVLEHHTNAKAFHDEAVKTADEIRNPTEEKKKRDFGEAPGETATGEYDDQGRPILKSEQREADKEEREKEREEKKAQKERERDAAEKRQAEERKRFKLQQFDDDFAKNPTGLSLKDYAQHGSGHVQALAQQATREEDVAKQRQLVGDFKGATEHQNRAEQLKKSLGLPSKDDQRDQIKKGLDESENLKAIRKNTENSGANK